MRFPPSAFLLSRRAKCSRTVFRADCQQAGPQPGRALCRPVRSNAPIICFSTSFGVNGFELPFHIGAVTPLLPREFFISETFKQLCCPGCRRDSPADSGFCALMIWIVRATGPEPLSAFRVICDGWAWTGMNPVCFKVQGPAFTTPGSPGCVDAEPCLPVVAPVVSLLDTWSIRATVAMQRATGV